MATSSFAGSVEEELRGIANATQKGLPMQISDEMQATSITASGNAMLLRYHFLKKPPAASIVETLKKEFFENSINADCTHPDMKALIDRGAYFKYEYYASDNRFVLGYAIDKNICIRGR